VSKFDYDAAKAPPAFKEATRETPEYLGQSIVIVPLSIGVGFAVLLGGLLICWGLQKSGRGALVAGGVAMAGCALFAFWRVFKDELYMAIETITGHDWNRDGWIGQPPEERLITIEITNPNNNNLQYLQIPESLFLKMPMIAHLLQAGKPFSEGAMTGTGRPLSRSEFHNLRDVLFDRGLARWRDERYPTQGVELTGYGKSVMRQMAELSTTPPRMRTQGMQNALPESTVGEWEED